MVTQRTTQNYLWEIMFTSEDEADKPKLLEKNKLHQGIN